MGVDPPVTEPATVDGLITTVSAADISLVYKQVCTSSMYSHVPAEDGASE